MRLRKCWRVRGLIAAGVLSCLGLAGCQTTSQHGRDVVTDQAMSGISAPSSSETLAAPAQPQPGFNQEPTKSQSP